MRILPNDDLKKYKTFTLICEVIVRLAMIRSESNNRYSNQFKIDADDVFNKLRSFKAYF